MKLVELMQLMDLKILKNIQTQWISMLSPAVQVMKEYRVFLVKMFMDFARPVEDEQGKKAKVDKKLMALARKNLNHLTNIQILLGLSGLLPLLQCVHSLMQFAQGRDVFVCDYVSAIQICIAEVIAFYIDGNTSFTQDVFWNFKDLTHVRQDAIPMTWVQSTFDLNSDGAELLHFTRNGYSIPATYRHGDKEGAASVTREVYSCIMDDTKKLCTGNALPL